jgi:hypothetical protein
MLGYAGIAAAVDSVSLSPLDDVIFTGCSDSKTLSIQVTPAEAGVDVMVNVSPNPAVVDVSSEILATDTNGSALLTISPGSEMDTVFLTVVAGGIESDAIFVTNQCPGDVPDTNLSIVPESLQIALQDNPNANATIMLAPAKMSTVTLLNQNPDIVTIPTSLATDINGIAELMIVANKGGTATVKAMAEGVESNELIITVISCTDIVTNVTDIQLSVTQEVTFTATGGCSGYYNWTATDGLLEPTGNKLIYTAPNSTGLFEVNVKDDKKSATIAVRVIGSVGIRPTELYLAPGSTAQVRAMGGEPPYGFSVVTGLATVEQVANEPHFAKVTAPNVLGQFIVAANDSLGTEAQATITVVGPVQFSRQEIEITTENQSETVEIQDGQPPFQVVVEKGNVSLAGRTITLVPPIENGPYKLKVKDAIGTRDETTVNVRIPGRLAISPEQQSVGLGQTITFFAVGGKEPYTFLSSQGNLSCNNNCASTNLTVDGIDSDIIVQVTDSTGAEATATVEVTQPIRFVPNESPVTIFAGETKEFKVVGGSNAYYFSSDFGLAEDIIQQTGSNIVTFTAPKYSTQVTLIAEDSRGNEPATIVFDVHPIGLGVTPSIYYLDLGGTSQTFEIISGPENTQFKVWSEMGKAMRKDSKILYTPPQGLTISDVLHVVSLNTGSQATAEIKVAQALSIAPAVMYVDAGATKTFHVSGGAGTYQFNARYGSFDPPFAKASEAGVDVTYFSPGLAKMDDVITVTDSKGRKNSGIVRLNNQLSIMPQVITLAQHAQTEFIGLQGVGPYTPSATGGNIEPIGGTATEVRYRYTAPAETGKYTMTITDSKGNTVSAEILVTGTLKMITELAVIRPGETTTVQAVGGSGPYHFTTTVGHLSEQDEDSVRYTAPMNFEGDNMVAYVKAFDRRNEQVSTEIRVIKTPKSQLTANSTTFTEGDKLNLNLTVLGMGQADAYAAAVLPDGQLFFFGENGAVTQEFMPYRQNMVFSETTTHETVFSLETFPNLGMQGPSTLYSLLVKPGTPTQDVLNPANWLCENWCSYSTFDFELK